MSISWGPVYITKGEHSGRIGYFDDEDVVSSDEEDISEELLESSSWREPSENAEVPKGSKVLDVAIVYFGGFFLAKGYYLIPKDSIRYVTTDDLMRRREELHDLCGQFAKVKNPELDLEPEDEDSYLRELHYVDSTLVDRIVQARYSNTKKGKKIFISHSSKDKTFARWIGTDLKESGHNPWLDEWEIKIGESIPTKISEGVKVADFVIVILSENAVKSNWVEKEWQNKYWDEVNSGEIHILPILYQDCEIPELLKTKRYADFRNGYNDGLEDVLAAIDSLTNPGH